MDGGRDCATRIHLHLPRLRLSPGVSARAGHSRPTLDYKTFPGASLRYTPGGLRRGDTHARGGRTPHPTGYARGSAHSEAPRRARRGLPRATWLLEAPAATARKSARIA